MLGQEAAARHAIHALAYTLPHTYALWPHPFRDLPGRLVLLVQRHDVQVGRCSYPGDRCDLKGSKGCVHRQSAGLQADMGKDWL